MRKVFYLMIGLAGITALGIVYWYQKHWLYQIGLPLDDAYIHLQFARNLLKGEWFVYYPGGKPTPGDTSPLWVLLIALGGIFSQNLIMVSLILGGVFYLLTGIMGFHLGEKILKDKWFTLAYSLVVILTGRMLWGAVSGMEITLFSFLSLLGVWLYLRDKVKGKLSVLTGMIFGLASNARPEGNLLFVFALLDWVGGKMLQEKKFKVSFTPWGAVLGFLILALPYPLFSFFSTGHLTPNTFRATQIPFDWSRSWEYLRLVISFLYHDHLLVHLALFLGILVFLINLIRGSEQERTNFLCWLWPVGYLLVSFFLTPIKYHFQRYLIPVLPFFILLSFYGFSWLFSLLKDWLGKEKIKLVPAVTTSLLILWAGYITIYYWPHLTALCVKNIDEMQVKIGNWLRDNTGPDDVIAANDIGAIFFISERPGLDLVGLVNPELLEKVRGLKIPSQERDRLTFEHLLEKKPDYLVIFPNWYPEIVEKAEYFKPVFSARLTDNIICAGDEMVVYKCDWQK